MTIILLPFYSQKRAFVAKLGSFLFTTLVQIRDTKPVFFEI